MNGPSPPAGPLLLIVDANVLIDYALSDRSMLALAARHLGPVHVPLPILEEVGQLSRDDCQSLGLILLDPTLEELSAAATPGSALSFEDTLCLVLAKAGGFTCVTNDKRLRRACGEAGVPIRWGLQLMRDLVLCRELTPDAAIATARLIRTSNPLHITEAILREFERQIHAIPHRLRDAADEP